MYYLSSPICIVEFLSLRSTHLRLNPACFDGGEAGEAAGRVGEVALLLENTLGLGADPRHLGAVRAEDFFIIDVQNVRHYSVDPSVDEPVERHRFPHRLCLGGSHPHEDYV